MKDFENYNNGVEKELSGADALWFITWGGAPPLSLLYSTESNRRTDSPPPLSPILYKLVEMVKLFIKSVLAHLEGLEETMEIGVPSARCSMFIDLQFSLSCYFYSSFLRAYNMYDSTLILQQLDDNNTEEVPASIFWD